MKPTDTPRTNALLTELGLVEETTFDHIVKMAQRHADFTRQLERENKVMRDVLEVFANIGEGDVLGMGMVRRVAREAIYAAMKEKP